MDRRKVSTTPQRERRRCRLQLASRPVSPDHKVFTSLLQPPIAQVCDQRLPTEQCGCVRGRGTARVMHTSRQFARRAAAHKRPCALIFADLVKAFDRVLRAVVMGDSSINDDPASGGHVRERWSESGVPDKVVDDAIASVRKTGGVVSEAVLHLGVLHMLHDLHDGSWFRLDGGHLIVTSLGSGQGCKIVAIISNLMYCRALDDLRYALRNEGLLSVFAQNRVCLAHGWLGEKACLDDN